MVWWQVVLSLLLGSNVVIEIVKAISSWKEAKQKRKEELEDRAMDKNDKTQTQEERFDDFCEKQAQENREIRRRLSGVESAIDNQSEIISSGEYISIRREALSYIKSGEVEAEDRVLLREQYNRYRAISKRKDLDEIMVEVDKLPTTKKEEFHHEY